MFYWPWNEIFGFFSVFKSSQDWWFHSVLDSNWFSHFFLNSFICLGHMFWVLCIHHWLATLYSDTSQSFLTTLDICKWTVNFPICTAEPSRSVRVVRGTDKRYSTLPLSSVLPLGFPRDGEDLLRRCLLHWPVDIRYHHLQLCSSYNCEQNQTASRISHQDDAGNFEVTKWGLLTFTACS